MFDELTQGIQFLFARHDLMLLRPEGLLLLLALPVFLLIGLWMASDMHWWRRWLIQLLRLAILAIMALALARPVKVSELSEPAVVLLADLSDSISDSGRTRVEEEVRRFWEAREEAPVSVVGFGSLPTLLAGPQHRRPGSLSERDRVPVTDMASALRFSYVLFPPQHDRRVVIFSDGAETRGNLLREAARARELGIEVSAYPILPVAREDVRLEKVDIPAAVRVDEEVPVHVEIVSSSRRKIGISLSLNGRKVARRVVQVESGHGQVEFGVSVEDEGWHEVSARVWAADDRYTDNNLAACRFHAAGRPRVLLVRKDCRENPLASLISGQGFELDMATPADMPKTLKEINEFDLLILENLALDKFETELVGQLKTYVEEFGGGLLLVAGESTAGLAGPDDVPVERLLPVHFRQVKKKEKIPAALAFVLDRSSSMSRSQKFVILLRAVADALERLKDNAQVTVVMFDDFPEVVVELTEAKQREAIRKVVMAQRVGGGTSIYPALKAAHRELKKSAAKLKHIILLSDGQSISLYAHYGYVVEKIADDKVTVTTIALGEDADQAELKRISARSGGRFYYADSMNNVPRIFAAETEDVTEDDVVEQKIKAIPAKLVEVLAGIDFTKAPALQGYLASEARPTSEVLLHSSDRKEPLLARWRFGLGRVAVLATDAQDAWAAAWVKWDGFKVLWPRIVHDSMRSSPPGDMRIEGLQEGDRGLVTIRVPEVPGEHPDPPRLFSVGEKGQLMPLDTVRRGLGVYHAEIRFERPGAHAFQAEREGRGGALERAFASLSHTYQEEYLSPGGNPELLGAVTRATGGKIFPRPEDIFAPGRQKRKEHQEKWPPLVFIAMGLFLAEVLIRRL